MTGDASPGKRRAALTRRSGVDVLIVRTIEEHPDLQ
jgi:hypothetical protein